MATPAGRLADWLSCLAAMSGGLAYHSRYNHASVHIIALITSIYFAVVGYSYAHASGRIIYYN